MRRIFLSNPISMSTIEIKQKNKRSKRFFLKYREIVEFGKLLIMSTALLYRTHCTPGYIWIIWQKPTFCCKKDSELNHAWERLKLYTLAWFRLGSRHNVYNFCTILRQGHSEQGCLVSLHFSKWKLSVMRYFPPPWGQLWKCFSCNILCKLISTKQSIQSSRQ